MRVKKFYVGLMAAAIAATSAANAFAAPEVDFSIDTETGISEFIINSAAKNKIAVEILDAADTALLENLNYTNIGNVLKYATEAECDENGTAKLTYKLTFKSGNYRAVVSDGSADAWIKDFYFISGEDKQRLLEEIVAAYSNEEDLQRLTEDNAVVLNLDLELYNKLKQNEKEKDVYKLLVKGEKPKTLDEYKNAFAKSSKVCTILSADAEEIADLFVGENAIADISDGVKKLYNETLSDESRKAVNNDIAALDGVSTLKEIEDKFGGQCVYRAACEKSYLDFELILENGKEVIGEDIYNSYKALKSAYQTAVAKEICKGNTAKNFEEWKTKLAQLIKNPPKNNYSGSGSGGGSGSSGSSSKGDKKNTAASSQLQIPIIPPKKDGSDIPGNADFTDMRGFEWAEDAVKKLALAKIVYGKSENEYCPRDAVTREEFISILMRAFNIKAENGENIFSDVKEGAWYYNDVSAAYKLGLVFGTDSENFGVGRKITRQEMCVLCYRFAKYSGVKLSEETSFPFTDEAADYAKEAVAALYNSGIVSGVGGNEFLPEASANRAEAARIIYSLLSFAKLI